MTVWEPDPNDPYDDHIQVCYRHGRINACRLQEGKFDDSVNCLWTDDPAKVEAIVAYQQKGALTWQVGEEWYPGMPCNKCGSKNTWEDGVEGGQCGNCGASDANE